MKLIKTLILMAIITLFLSWLELNIYWTELALESTQRLNQIPVTQKNTQSVSDSGENVWIKLKFTKTLSKPKVFELSPIFVRDNPIMDKSATIESITWNIIRFLVYTVSGLSVLWIIVWWFMVMVAWTSDLATQWKMTIVYSIAWMAFTIGSYALVKLVQIITFSLW